MTGKGETPKYAVRLVAVLLFAGLVFFGGLQLFVPEGSKLTGSYDAKSLRYIASAPLSYAGSESCGASNCHADLFNKWSTGAHGSRQEKSRCEVCHGPQGTHPSSESKLVKVRGDGNIVELCLSCHRKMKARTTTGQPQITPSEHPFPHEGTLNCLQCHDPHSPGIKIATANQTTTEPAATTNNGTTNKRDSDIAKTEPSVASSCSGCHGPAGRGGFAPVLADQSVEDLRDKLTRFRSGELKGTMMNTVAANLTDENIDVLATYFASH